MISQQQRRPQEHLDQRPDENKRETREPDSLFFNLQPQLQIHTRDRQTDRQTKQERMWNLGKVEGMIASKAVRPGDTLVVIVASGSFNPPHKLHLRMMELAKEAVESKQRKVVVGGFLVPSSDGYVSSKLGRDAYKLTERVEMSRRAVEDSPWLEASGLGIASSMHVAHDLDQALQAHFRGAYTFEVRLVFGADFVEKTKCWDKQVIAISRKGSDDPILAAIRSRTIHKDFLFVGPGEVVAACDPGEPTDMSSTAIRRILTRDSLFHFCGTDDFWDMPFEQRQIAAQLYHYLPDAVLRYIFQRGGAVLK